MILEAGSSAQYFDIDIVGCASRSQASSCPPHTCKLGDMSVVQRHISSQFGGMPHLQWLILNNNNFSGDLTDFSEAIPHHSKLQWLDIADNQLSGPLFAPALVGLAVFASMDDEFSLQSDRRSRHVFNASGDRPSGAVSQEIVRVHPIICCKLAVVFSSSAQYTAQLCMSDISVDS